MTVCKGPVFTAGIQQGAPCTSVPVTIVARLTLPDPATCNIAQVPDPGPQLFAPQILYSSKFAWLATIPEHCCCAGGAVSATGCSVPVVAPQVLLLGMTAAENTANQVGNWAAHFAVRVALLEAPFCRYSVLIALSTQVLSVYALLLSCCRPNVGHCERSWSHLSPPFQAPSFLLFILKHFGRLCSSAILLPLIDDLRLV